MNIKTEREEPNETPMEVTKIKTEPALVDSNQPSDQHDSGIGFKGLNEPSTEEQLFKCSFCDRAWSNRFHLKRHMRKMHSEVVSKRQMEEPVAKVKVKTEKLFQCQTCRIRFSTMSSLNRHEKVHSGDKPYACILCDYKTAHMSNLQRHTLIVHPQTAKVNSVPEDKTTKASLDQQPKHILSNLETSDDKNISQRNHVKPMDNLISVVSNENLENGQDQSVIDEPIEPSPKQAVAESESNNIQSIDKPGVYKCKKCGQCLADKISLKRHLKDKGCYKGTALSGLLQITSQRSCSMCDFTGTLADIAIHVKNVHKDDKPFGCKQCDKRFTRKKTLDAHVLNHQGTADISDHRRPTKLLIENPKYEEKKIDSKTEDADEKAIPNIKQEPAEIESTNSKTDVVPKTYSCKTCGKTYHDKIRYRKHERKHFMDKKIFSCSLCDYKTSILGHLGIHSRSAHANEEKPHQCDHCDKSFTKNSTLAAHKKNHHAESREIQPANSKEIYQLLSQNHKALDNFDDTTDTTLDMTHEVKKEIPDESVKPQGMPFPSERLYKCIICNKSCSSKFNLKRHIQRLHSDQYTDELLIDVQSQQEMLEQYNSQNEESADDEALADECVSTKEEHGSKSPLTCSICYLQYTSRSGLYKHMRKSHPSGQSQSSLHSKRGVRGNGIEKPFSCQICNAKFGYKDNLTRHIKNQHPEGAPRQKVDASLKGEKDVVARMDVGEGSVDEGVFRKRENETEPLKSHVCKICKKQYNNRSNLRRHIRKWHDGQYPVEETPSNEPTALHRYPTKDNEKTFRNPLDLTKHSVVHASEKPYACKICGDKFAYRSSWKRHMFKQHREECASQDEDSADEGGQEKENCLQVPQKGGPKCQTCGKSFKDRYQLSLHQVVHTGEKPYFCKVCGNRFAWKKNLALHMRKQHREDCESQAEDSADEELMNEKTKLSEKLSGKVTFACKTCGKIFPNSYKLNIHSVVHTGDKPYSCQLCPFKSGFRCSLKKHVRKKHGQTKGDCDSQSDESADETILGQKNRSSQSKRGSKWHGVEKPFSCSVCDLKFGYKDNMKRHLKTKHPRDYKLQKDTVLEQEQTTVMIENSQSDESADETILGQKNHAKKSHKCMECSASYTLKKSLQRHVRNQHSAPSKRQESERDDCSQSEADTENKHVEKKINIVPEKPLKNEKAFTCEKCVKSYASASDLRKHLVSSDHNKEKPYSCKICHLRFVFKDSVRRHMRNFHRNKNDCDSQSDDTADEENVSKPYERGSLWRQIQKPFSCNLCKEKYGYKDNLKRHLKSRHLKEYNSQSFDSLYLETNTQSKVQDIGCKEDLSETDESLKPTKQEFSARMTFACTVCNMKFGYKDNLKKHMKSQHHEAYESQMESQSDESAVETDSGQQIYEIGEKPHRCIECNSSFTLKKNLQRHIRNQHPEMHKRQKNIRENDSQREKTFRCQVCDMSFGYTKSLRRHMEHIHKETIESHDEKTAKDGTIPEISNRCLPCDKDFGVPSRLKEHNVAVHKGEKPFRCKICESTFGYKRNLYTHMATIHKEGCDSQDEDSDTEKFQGFNSKNRSNQSKRGSQWHGVEKPFSCSVCDLKFGYKDNMKRHLKTKHPRDYKLQKDTVLEQEQTTVINENSNDKVYSCIMCKFECHRKDSLKRHMKKFHSGEYSKELLEDVESQREMLKKYESQGEETGDDEEDSNAVLEESPVSSEGKDFRCNSCDKVFTHRHYLKRHELCHTEDRPFKCVLCSSSYNHKDHLVSHVAKSHAERNQIKRENRPVVIPIHSAGKDTSTSSRKTDDVQSEVRNNRRKELKQALFKDRPVVKVKPLKISPGQKSMKVKQEPTNTKSRKCRICKMTVDGGLELEEHVLIYHAMDIDNYERAKI